MARRVPNQLRRIFHPDDLLVACHLTAERQFIEILSSKSGRGSPNWSAQLPVEPRPISLLDS